MSELQIARGEELAFVRRAFPLLRRWGEFNGRVLELDAEAAAGGQLEERERKQREAGGGRGGEEEEGGEQQEAAATTEQAGGPSSPSSSASSLSARLLPLPPPPLLLPSELLWREFRTTFLGSLEEFGSLAEFNDGVLAWARVLEDEMSAALGGAVDLLGGGGGGSEDGGQQRALGAAASSSHPTAALTGSLVSAARASRDLGVRARVKAALRVRPQIRLHQRRQQGRGQEEGGDEENDGGGGGEGEGAAREQRRSPSSPPPPVTPPPPTLASPSAPQRAPKLARAAWRDQRVMLVLYALAAIGELPEREHDEALATLLLKKLSDLPAPAAAAAARR